jgi:hypothetical protein
LSQSTILNRSAGDPNFAASVSTVRRIADCQKQLGLGGVSLQPGKRDTWRMLSETSATPKQAERLFQQLHLLAKRRWPLPSFCAGEIQILGNGHGISHATKILIEN